MPSGQSGFYQVAPDVVVEVVSPSNTFREMTEKVQLYLAAGSSQAWVVEPIGQVITVYHADGSARVYRMGDEIDCSDFLPGLRLRLADIFKS